MFRFSVAFTPENRESKRGEASLIQLIPPPLSKGGGIKGEGYLNQKLKGGEVQKVEVSLRY